MKHRVCVPLCTMVLFMLLSACQDDMESRSFVSKFRILGVQANPPEAIAGENVEIRGIFAPVVNHPASVAFVTVDTQWIAQLGDLLPDDVDQYTDAQLEGLLDSLAASGQMTTEEALALMVPQFTVMVQPVEPVTGLALLPAENIIISPALVAIMKLMGQTAGLPVYMLGCSNGVIDEAALLHGVNGLRESQEIGDLESACIGDDATAIVSFKTLNIRVSDSRGSGLAERNLNPEIQLFKFDGTMHQANTPPLDTGRLICDSKDGCREPVEMQLAVFKKDFQFFDGFSRTENEMESMFVSWFSNGGDFSNERIRSDDAQAAANAMADGDVAGMEALLSEPNRRHWFTVEWMPPVAGGIFNLWVVVNDLRGGVGYARYRIRADAPNY